MTIELRVEGDGIEVIGLEPDEVNLLAYVAELLQHGMTPRIINITPDMIRQEMERAMGDEDLTDVKNLRDSDEALWEIAKRADQEVENNLHFLERVNEDMEEVA